MGSVLLIKIGWFALRKNPLVGAKMLALERRTRKSRLGFDDNPWLKI
jgi:hypothetical protein